jgi:hypothetical protein
MGGHSQVPWTRFSLDAVWKVVQTAGGRLPRGVDVG